MSAGISAATEEQTANSRQVSKAVEHVNELTQTAASSAEEMSGATEELSRMANELQRLVGQFRISASRETAVALSARSSFEGSSLRTPSGEERVRFITCKGQQILYVDFSDGTLDDMHAIIEQSATVIRSQPVKSLLLLTNVHDLAFNPASAAEMQRYAQGNEPFVFAAAVVGLEGLKKIVYQTIRKASGQNMMAFSDIEKAKQWLIERKREHEGQKY
jgi:hypothetical protein